MLKLILVPILCCAAFTGCQLVRKSSTWDTVARLRVDTRDADDPSTAYAVELHRTLAKQDIEHKVVTYQYRYTTRLREEAVATRTSVIYRDEARPNHPWWIMDERTHKPVWLPNQDVARQVRFHVSAPVELLELREFPSGQPVSGKTMLGATEEKRPNFFVRTGRTIVRLFTGRRPATEEDRRREFLRTRTGSESPAPPTPPQEDYAALFRARHGTDFNEASAVDRRKMAALTRTAPANPLPAVAQRTR